MARGQRRLDGVERVGQRGGDLVLVQVLGAGLDVVVVGLEPLVVVGGDPVAEDVHGLRLALEPDGQLLGDERVGQVRRASSAPAIVSWSVIVTKSIPRRLASS